VFHLLDRKKHMGLTLFLVICLFLFSGCASESADQIDNDSETESEYIIITGLAEEEIQLTVKEVKNNYEPVSAHVTSIDSAGNEEQYHVKGALFHDILMNFDASQKELYAIRLVAGDGYQIEVPSEVLKARDVILAYEINEEPLDDKTKPLRAVIPDERAMYWVRNLTNIETLKGSESETEEVTNIVLMETAFKTLNQEDYTYYENIDKAVKIEDLMSQFEVDPSIETVSFAASDGFEKNETGNIFMNSYLKITGEDAPLFLSPDMPKGMYVKNVLYCAVEDTLFMSAEQALAKYPVNDEGGISLSDIFADINITKSSNYVLTGADGYSVEVKAEDIETGIIAKDTEGEYRIKFSDLDKSSTVKDILMIESK